jgi:hypothetical protein
MHVPSAGQDGSTVWQASDQLVMYEGDYAHIGAEAARTGLVREGPLAAAGALLCPVAALVDLARAWMERHRDLSGWGVAPNMTGVREAPVTAL